MYTSYFVYSFLFFGFFSQKKPDPTVEYRSCFIWSCFGVDRWVCAHQLLYIRCNRNSSESPGSQLGAVSLFRCVLKTVCITRYLKKKTFNTTLFRNRRVMDLSGGIKQPYRTHWKTYKNLFRRFRDNFSRFKFRIPAAACKLYTFWVGTIKYRFG